MIQVFLSLEFVTGSNRFFVFVVGVSFVLVALWRVVVALCLRMEKMFNALDISNYRKKLVPRMLRTFKTNRTNSSNFWCVCSKRVARTKSMDRAQGFKDTARQTGHHLGRCDGQRRATPLCPSTKTCGRAWIARTLDTSAQGESCSRRNSGHTRVDFG